MNQKILVGWVLALSALNWGLSGVLGINLIETLLSPGSVLSKVVYGIIGLIGIYKIYLLATAKK